MAVCGLHAEQSTSYSAFMTMCMLVGAQSSTPQMYGQQEQGYDNLLLIIHTYKCIKF